MGALGVVLDTNVLVSALGFGGPPLDVLLRTFEDDVRLIASEETIDELERVILSDGIVDRFEREYPSPSVGLSPSDIQPFPSNSI